MTDAEMEREARRLRGLVYSEMNYLCNDFDKKLNRLEEQFKSALARVRDKALEEAAKFCEEKCWNDYTYMTNQKDQAFRTARCLRALRSKGRKETA